MLTTKTEITEGIKFLEEILQNNDKSEAYWAI